MNVVDFDLTIEIILHISFISLLLISFGGLFFGYSIVDVKYIFMPLLVIYVSSILYGTLRK